MTDTAAKRPARSQPQDMPATLDEALARLQADLPKVSKSHTAKVPTKSGGEYSYSYADLADVCAELLPKMAALGLSFSARPTVNEVAEFGLAWKLRHWPSHESDEGWWPLRTPVTASPQATGSDITYARRYCLGAVTGLVTEDDDDGQAARDDRGSRNGGKLRSPNGSRDDSPAENGDGPRPDPVAQALAKLAVEIGTTGTLDDLEKKVYIVAQRRKKLRALTPTTRALISVSRARFAP